MEMTLWRIVILTHISPLLAGEPRADSFVEVARTWQGQTLNHGKPLSSRTGPRVATGDAADGNGGNRTMRNVALQQGLRAAYRTVVEEPLPDRLLALLQQLDGDGPTR
jgi:hypothetical protein